jgi:hypothetical protein
MSTTRTAIGEHDVVTLREAVDGWPTGTKGAVVIDLGSRLLVEIADGSGECLDIVSVSPEQLQLVWTSP